MVSMMLNDNERPPFDHILVKIADYVHDYKVTSSEALTTAHYCLLDAFGCAILALHEPECQRHIGPLVPGATFAQGVRIPGTGYELEPVHAAFNIGTLVRWLDYNDTWLAAEWGHPSDNLGAILACADYVARQQRSAGYDEFTVHHLLVAMVKAYEIQGIMALGNSFNNVGIDHVILVKLASTAVATWLLGGDKQATINALSNVWLDGGALRTYRHAPNTGWRKSWAAGDATSRAVRHALMAIAGEMGYPSALTVPRWGFYDVVMKAQPFKLTNTLASYVMENILFKVSFPAEFHAQTAVECALQLHKKVVNRLEKIEHIDLKTQSAAMRIINKTGPLHNHADRDHSLQYAVAIGLIFGELQGLHYSDEIAADPRIDVLRDKMAVTEDKRYTLDYHDPYKRSIGNSVTVHFNDGTVESEAVEYPLGHRRRRAEAYPLLIEKFNTNLRVHFEDARVDGLMNTMLDQELLWRMPVSDFMALWAD